MKKRVMLVAEDDEDQVVLLKRALLRAQVNIDTRIVRNGEEAMGYLQARGKYSDREEFPFPVFVLLDIKMPKMNGLEVLEAIRGDPGLCRLVVVMFTCSDHEHDINRASDLHANSYLIKPSNPTALSHLTEKLEEYWCILNKCGEIAAD